MVRILVTLPKSEIGQDWFPPEAIERLEALGDVVWNETDERLPPDELQQLLDGIDIVVTRWSGNPRLDAEILQGANQLDLIAHVGGSVAATVTEAAYDRGITVVSANRVLATYVAEGTLAMMLSALRSIPTFTNELHSGNYHRNVERLETLFDRSVGLVGLGHVGQELLSLLEPFDVSVRVYDPYVDPGTVEPFDFVEFTSLETVLAESQIVSVHAGKTEETIHLLDADRLSMLQDGALLVNTARGAIVDQDALVNELRSERISAALDVFETEPLPADSELRQLDNVILTPHVADCSPGRRLAITVIDEIERYVNGDALQHAIPREKYEVMTRNWLTSEDN